MLTRLHVSSRFNGPLESGNGGYCAGMLARFFDTAAEVSLRRPVPLDTPLDVERAEDDSVRLLHGEELVAEGHAVPDFEIELPDAVSLPDARAAATRYRGLDHGVFSRCFVCGRAREDAFGVFAGAVDGRQVVASPWTPPEWTADESGYVRPEFAWATLDCPTYFALYMDGELPLSVMARMTGRVHAPLVAGEEQVVMAWPIERDGRKHHAGAAILSARGEPRAVARALLIAPR